MGLVHTSLSMITIDTHWDNKWFILIQDGFKCLTSYLFSTVLTSALFIFKLYTPRVSRLLLVQPNSFKETVQLISTQNIHFSLTTHFSLINLLSLRRSSENLKTLFLTVLRALITAEKELILIFIPQNCLQFINFLYFVLRWLNLFQISHKIFNKTTF